MSRWRLAQCPPADLAGARRYPFACMQDVSKSLGAKGGGICTDALPLGLTATLGIDACAGGDIRDAVKRACCSQRAKSSLRVAGSVSGFSHSN